MNTIHTAMAERKNCLPGFALMSARPATISFSFIFGIFTSESSRMRAITPSASETYQTPRQSPVVSKINGAQKNAMMVPQGIHWDQMPTAMPICLRGNRRGRMFGPQTQIRPYAQPSIARPKRNSAASEETALIAVPAIMMAHEMTTMALTPILRMTSAPGKAMTSAQME